MKPQVIAHELGKRLRNDAIVSSDSGTNTSWWARHILAKRGQKHSVSGTLATMGPGVPYGIGAKFGHPEAASVVISRRLARLGRSVS